ncbi:MAG: hypothetical protein H7Y27_11815 [Gemmatimonadaceae bacterium]|nr:hypothetical protein [Chitinophagaceae bacterium]
MKKFSLVAILCLFLSAGFSQTFLHGAGVSLSLSKSSGTDPVAYSGFHYNPRINVLETEKIALSVGIPLVLAGSFSYNYSSSMGSNSDFQYLLQVPVTLNLNIGRGSTKENTSRMGFFVGGGWAFNQGSFNSTIEDPLYNNYYYEIIEDDFNMGPSANAGLRIGVGRRHRNIEVRLNYMKAISGSLKPHVFGVTSAFNF